MSETSWTVVIDDPDVLRTAFADAPDARYRPLPLWWWSGEPLDEERLLWQLEQIHRLGCGAVCITGLALHGPAVGSPADQPEGYTPEWLRLFRTVCERARELGMKVISWSPLQVGGPLEAYRLAAEHPEFGAETLTPNGPQPWGFDYGNPDAVAALVGPESVAGRYLDSVDDLLGDVIVASFEDEFPYMPRWSATFAEEFRRHKGYDLPIEALVGDIGPRTPAIRWDYHDVAAARLEAAYTHQQREWVNQHDLLAGFDQMDRRGDPRESVAAYIDPFRTMAWATAPGTDQMGDARFALSLADIHGAPRVWLEGFHSHGWGHQPALQARLLFEWVREGANLYLPHGGYYSTRAGWWEWAPPEMLWRQPTSVHHAPFAEAVGRLLTVMSAGRHVPDVAVLHPLSTLWAGAERGGWTTDAVRAADTYLDLFGIHGTPSAWTPEAAERPSLLAEAGYDRIVLDEAHLDAFDVPIIVPACTCLRTETVERLLEGARRGRVVVFVGHLPAASAERGRDDQRFAALVDDLRQVSVTVDSAADALAALPPARVSGLKSQWRRVGGLDVVCLTGTGRVRLIGMADRRPERWDIETGVIDPHGAVADGEDLLVDVSGPITALALPIGRAEPPTSPPATVEIPLPEVWDCEYVAWGENRWGDLRLPPNPGPPPVERRTFAHREGDQREWALAPVVPEDVEHPFVDVGFEARMWGESGRPTPSERTLGDGWREVVATYGPKAVIDGERLAEYSERLGVEDLVLTSHIGLKGRVEPVKVDLGPGGEGRIVSYGHVPSHVRTHLVVEACGVITVELDGVIVAGPVDAGVVAVPVTLSAGWHEVAITICARSVAPSPLSRYMVGPRARVAWAFTDPYRRDPVSIWGAPLVHPDYKGSPGPRRFRRVVTLPSRASLAITAAASGGVEWNVGSVLEAGQHEIVATVARSLDAPTFQCELTFTMESDPDRDGGSAGGAPVVVIVSDVQWETQYGEGEWEVVFPVGTASWVNPPFPGAPTAHRSPLLDVAWLEGDESVAGHCEDVWADAPEPPPPAWFCFTAAPGARAIRLPVEGTIDAWVDGVPTPVIDQTLALREHARVALRVQAPPGRRGAACFTEHPILELGPGTIRTGRSWHRQGLDSFAGVIVYRTEVEIAEGGAAILDLDEVAGTVAVFVNGQLAGTRTWAPWRIPVTLVAGVNRIEVEVASTLGPAMARGNPTPFGPEDQRVAGLIGRPRLELFA